MDILSLKLGIAFLYDKKKAVKQARSCSSAQEFFGLYREKIEKIRNSDEFEKARSFIENNDVSLISIWDKAYPEALLDLQDAPIVLFVEGDVSRLNNSRRVGIVGSRRASAYGLNAAQSFAYELAQLNISVISGLAIGIDTYAHKGALKAGGITAAVIGSGLADMYPKQNRALSERIIGLGGVVISEYPPFVPPMRYNFPRRNRIISALSEVLLVMEAGKRSGALITAGFSLDLGRDVFSLPGQINAVNSMGSNKLIFDGAIPLLSVEDVLLSMGINRKTAVLKNQREREYIIDKYNGNPHPILKLLNKKCRLDVEEICLALQKDASYVLKELMKLELNGEIKRKGAFVYIR